MSDRYYITTPIYYVNAAPHLGHAYTTIVADVLNRFHLFAGLETYFLTGTDEHGDKIVSAAQKLGEQPKTYVDRISGLFQALWPQLNISNSQFIRTTDPAHQETVRHILNRVRDNGDIYFSEYEGLYCFGCERFMTERELVQGNCPDHQTPPQPIKESNYFFRMSRYQSWLVEHIERYPDFIRPARYRNEALSFLSEPLEDLCISRPKSRLEWGITLPFDDRFVTYVWFDALINYVSALGFPDGERFKRFWPVAQHIIAKDILKPHGIYWPCMLKSAGIEPYQHLNVHGYWNVNEGKMSKTLGNVVKPLDLVQIYGLDAFRYFLLREMVFGLDSEFSEEGLVGRINADLANDLGNLVSRTLTMVEKYFEGRIPEAGPSRPEDEALRKSALHLVDQYANLMEGLALHKALMAIWEVIGQLNRYIDAMAPWVLAKSDRERLATVITHVFECLRILAGLLWPFMPATAEKMREQLGLAVRTHKGMLRDLKEWGGERPDRPIGKAPALFPRIERKEASLEKAGDAEPPSPDPKLPEIPLEAFQALDLRVGTILKAEEIPKSKNLFKLTVDVGDIRTVLSGLKGHLTVQDLEGRQVILVANLKPVTMMGIQSQGMVLAARDASGLHLMVPDGQMTPGTKVT